MESICCGTPVITYNCCGSPELLDENSGFVVNENDIDDILEKQEAIKKAPPQIDILAAHKRFDKNTCYKGYLEVYKKSKES